MLVYFKQKTAYEMRISDWSSDVCSSDLPGPGVRRAQGARANGWRQCGFGAVGARRAPCTHSVRYAIPVRGTGGAAKIGGASFMDRVWQYVLISVVDVTLIQ